MTVTLTRISDSTAEPVTLPEMKTHLRASTDRTDEDDLIQSQEIAARDFVESRTNRALVDQDWRIVRDEYPTNDRPIALPIAPVNGSSNVTVKTIGKDGTTTTFSSSRYIVDTDSEPGRVALKQGETWPSTDHRDAAAIRVDWTAGFGNTTDVPESLKSAVKLLTEHWYKNRGAVKIDQRPREVPTALESLIRRWEVPTVPFSSAHPKDVSRIPERTAGDGTITINIAD